ncbi:MAG: YggT family protein [Gammaproteobacteria bacterium]|nr:MAG: YggT family protein [Gammaproteobacteria bacterium]
MMEHNPYFTASAVFLIQALFGLYSLAVLLRLLLQWVRADFRNPFCQMLVRVTNPAVRPLRRLIPGWGGWDLASLLLLLLLQAAERFLVDLALGQPPSPGGILFGALAGSLELALNVFIVAVLIEVVLSWVAADSHHPLALLVGRLTEPVLRPWRRVIPPVAGVDLSPVFAILVLQLAKILVVGPLAGLGRGLA